MELRQLNYFVTIANSKSYSKASKILFISQPTLSWNIQQLEEEFDTRLFFQSQQGLHLTEDGEKLFTHGQELLKKFNELMTAMHQKKSGVKTLKIGMTVLFAIQHMERILSFAATNPELELSFIQSGSIEVQKKVAHNDIDVGLVSFPNYEPSIELERLNISHSNYSVSVVMPFTHPLAQKETLQIKDLKDYDMCSFSEDYVLGRIIHERCYQYGFNPRIIFVNKSWEVLLQNTLITNSVTLMPQALEKISNFKNLKWIPLKDKANFFNVGVAYKKDENLEDHVVQFIQFMKNKK